MKIFIFLFLSTISLLAQSRNIRLNPDQFEGQTRGTIKNGALTTNLVNRTELKSIGDPGLSVPTITASNSAWVQVRRSGPDGNVSGAEQFYSADVLSWQTTWGTNIWALKDRNNVVQVQANALTGGMTFAGGVNFTTITVSSGITSGGNINAEGNSVIADNAQFIAGVIGGVSLDGSVYSPGGLFLDGSIIGGASQITTDTLITTGPTYNSGTPDNNVTFPGLNIITTLGNFNQSVTACFTLTGVVGQNAKVSLIVFQEDINTPTYTFPVATVGVASVIIAQVSAPYIPGHYSFCFTNLSTGAATAAYVSGSYLLINR